MNETITRFDFLVKEFFKAQVSGHRTAEHYYLLQVLAYKQAEINIVGNKYTRLGQPNSSQYKKAVENIERKYDFFIQHAISIYVEFGTQTDDSLEVESSAEAQLVGNNEQTNEEVQLVGNNEQVNAEVQLAGNNEQANEEVLETNI